MEVVSKHRFARISPQKARHVANKIRGLSVDVALEFLTFDKKSASFLLKKVLNSSLANAEHNYGLDVDDLYISKVFIDEGPVMKRIMPRAKGQTDRINKRTSHITVALSKCRRDI